MKIVFYASDKPREIMLARAFESGVRIHGDDFEIRRTADYGEDRKYEGPSPDTDVAVVFGVKGQSKLIMKDHRMVGKSAIYMDKGYVRTKGEGGHTEYSRVSVNAAHPNAYFQRSPRQSDRWRALGIKLGDPRPRTKDGHILFCGSSQKYHDFNDLGDATEYAKKVFYRVRKHSNRQFVYRPKPSWKDARPVVGAMFSTAQQTIADALMGCHCLVTHGSSAAMDAIIAGVPAMVLGDGIASVVAETDTDKIEDPYWPDGNARCQWAYDMAYCQWTNEELRSGEAWKYLREEVVFQCA